MKISSIIFIGLVIPYALNAQNEVNKWYFGNKAGLDFNTTIPSIVLNSEMRAYEGCSSISDTIGNILFYTNGEIVWNRNHDTMANGSGLFGHLSSTSSALIVKKPGNNNLYYIFTSDVIKTISYIDTNKGVNYSIVDMDLNGGLGAVTIKNKQLFKYSNEKITAIHHQNKKDLWIASTKMNSDSIFLYLLTENGLSVPLISRNTKINTSIGIFKNTIGQIKYSSNGKYLAYVNSRDSMIHLMDFNNMNGDIKNFRNIVNFPSRPYGLEFSPNGKYLYITTEAPAHLFQIPIDKVYHGVGLNEIGTDLYNASGFHWLGGMQLGPDGKIYISKINDSFLSVINNPDSLLYSSDFNINGLFIKNTGNYGLPNLVQSYLLKSKIVSDTSCILESVLLKTESYLQIDSIRWNFGDNNSITSNGDSVRYKYHKSGNYRINATVFYKNGKDTLLFSDIIIRDYKPVSLGNDTVICEGEKLTLNFTPSINETFFWFDSSKANQIEVNQQGVFWIQVNDKFCTQRDSIHVKIGKKPIVYIGNDTTFCNKFNQVLDAKNGYKSYFWNTGETTYSITVNLPGIYTVKVKDTNLCDGGDTILLEEINKPTILKSLDTINCKYVYLNIERQKNLIYTWSTGDTGVHIKVDKKGHFIINATNKFCSLSDTIDVNLLPKPIVNLGSDTLICGLKQLKTNEIGHYLWSDNQTTPSILTNKPGVYWLKVTRNNCVGIDSIILSPCFEYTYFIPNSFSPNNDGINDVFKVYGNNIKSIHMQIYNRWGEKIFDIENQDPFWDSIYKNEECMSDIYTYVIKITGYNGKFNFVSGTFHLIK